MSFSISQINALAKLIGANPNEAKALVKLASIDVLKTLGDGKYTIALDNQTLSAQSEKPLREGGAYWTQIHYAKDTKPTLSNLVKMPVLFKTLQNGLFSFTLQEVVSLLKQPKPAAQLAQNILEKLASATTKEEFQNFSNLLLSLHHHTLTLPLQYHNRFALLQLKKRYNNRSKTTFIDFYAAFEFLGPVSGILSLQEDQIQARLCVAFERTKQFLEQDMKNFALPLSIQVQNTIEPLYESTQNSLLDVSI
ncbi:MAG: hypothetical protein AB7U24_00855 [Sulfurimonadaceae bacterium]|jgi:hypothetical protein